MQQSETFTPRATKTSANEEVVTAWEDNDIAVLTLTKPIVSDNPSSEAAVVCLNTDETEIAEDEVMSVSGWHLGTKNDNLKFAKVQYKSFPHNCPLNAFTIPGAPAPAPAPFPTGNKICVQGATNKGTCSNDRGGMYYLQSQPSFAQSCQRV